MLSKNIIIKTLWIRSSGADSFAGCVNFFEELPMNKSRLVIDEYAKMDRPFPGHCGRVWHNFLIGADQTL